MKQVPYRLAKEMSSTATPLWSDDEGRFVGPTVWLPLLLGVCFAGAAACGWQYTTGVVELAVAFLLGAFLGTSPFKIGALLFLPLAIPAVALAALASGMVFALAVLCVIAVILFNGLVAYAGMLARIHMLNQH